MRVLQQAILAFYNFLVGDIRILIGTFVALLATALLAPIAPGVAGLVLLVLLGATLVVSLRREVGS